MKVMSNCIYTILNTSYFRTQRLLKFYLFYKDCLSFVLKQILIKYYWYSVYVSLFLYGVALFPIIQISPSYPHMYNTHGFYNKFKLLVSSYISCLIVGPLLPYFIYRIRCSNV